MKYHEFVRIIEKEVNYNLKGGISASLYTTVKNNNQNRTGIILKRPDVNIAPTIYLEEFYERFQNGTGIGEIAYEIIKIYENAKCQMSWNPEALLDFEFLQDKIVFKIINTNQNKELLKTLPHIEFFDLSIVFYVLLETTERSTATMLISYENLKQWKVDIDRLVQTAVKNVKWRLPAQLYSMDQVMEEGQNQRFGKLTNLLEQDVSHGEDDIYILTNSIHNLGAASMAYPEMLKTIGDIVKSSYYILPSSIHEVIIVPDRLGMSFQHMSEMVETVNKTQVRPEEILSNHAYFYNRNLDELFMSEYVE